MSIKYFLIFLFFIPVPVLSQDEVKNRFLVSTEAGRYTIHDDETWGFGMNFNGGREFLSGFSWIAGLGFGVGNTSNDDLFDSGTNYFDIVIGVDWVILPKYAVSPYAGWNFGIINEHGFGDFTHHARFGLQIKLSSANSIRLSYQKGWHSADEDTGEPFRGPDLHTVGLRHYF